MGFVLILRIRYTLHHVRLPKGTKASSIISHYVVIIIINALRPAHVIDYWIHTYEGDAEGESSLKKNKKRNEMKRNET